MGRRYWSRVEEVLDLVPFGVEGARGENIFPAELPSPVFVPEQVVAAERGPVRLCAPALGIERGGVLVFDNGDVLLFSLSGAVRGKRGSLITVMVFCSRMPGPSVLIFDWAANDGL